MIDVEVRVSGILMCCDESIMGLTFGNDYAIKKVPFDDLQFKDSITDGRGQLIVDYFSSRLYDGEKTFFMCIEKESLFPIEGPHLDANRRFFTDRDFDCQEQLEPWKELESSFLYERIALLHLFKSGNIGFRDVFYVFRYNTGFMNNNLRNRSHQETRNIIDDRKFVLEAEEVEECNQFLSDFSGQAFGLMKHCIDEFVWGLEQIDIPTGFEQYTTALEMTLLEQNQQGKKQALANRVAVLVGENNCEIQQIHQKMLDYYRYRSESLHEGDGTNISDVELRELENLVRAVLKKCLYRCKHEQLINATVTWDEVKIKIINDLKNQVIALKGQGILPL